MSRRSISAFTKLDMMIVGGTLVMIAILVVYVQRRTGFTGARTSRLGCISNLKQIGLGFRMWSNDHGELFPWQVPVAQGGTKEFARLPYVELHYLAASNELKSPKILKYPNDTRRTRADSWDAPLHPSLSYFAGLTADETKPTTILVGDRNVSTNASTLKGFLVVKDTAQLQWTKDLHQSHGNIGMADGSVAQLSTSNLRKSFNAALEALTNQPVHLVIP